MKLNRFFIIVIISLFSSQVIALLPPYYQSVKEITAMLNDPGVIEQITSGRLIQSVVKTDTGYSISTGDCTLAVTVIYLPPPQGFVGPAQFQLKPEKLVCKAPVNPQ